MLSLDFKAVYADYLCPPRCQTLESERVQDGELSVDRDPTLFNPCPAHLAAARLALGRQARKGRNRCGVVRSPTTGELTPQKGRSREPLSTGQTQHPESFRITAGDSCWPLSSAVSKVVKLPRQQPAQVGASARRPRGAESAAGGGGGAVLFWQGLQASRRQELKAKPACRAPPCGPRCARFGSSRRRRRVSPLPWQVAFVLRFAGQGPSRPVTSVPQKGAERGGRGCGAVPGGVRRSPVLAESHLPRRPTAADLALTSLAPAPVAVLRALEIRSGLGERGATPGTSRTQCLMVRDTAVKSRSRFTGLTVASPFLGTRAERITQKWRPLFPFEKGQQEGFEPRIRVGKAS